MLLWLWILIIVIIILIVILISYFNRFAVLENRIDNSLSQIDVQLRKRADLIPNLINSVKGYMKHEKGVITEVTNARKALIGAKELPARVKAGDNLQSALGHLFAIAENYPNLKANENFLQMQNELAATEDKIAYSRQYYNDGIMSYNVSLTTIPGKWFASLYSFQKKEYLQIPAEARAVPKVSF